MVLKCQVCDSLVGLERSSLTLALDHGFKFGWDGMSACSRNCICFGMDCMAIAWLTGAWIHIFNQIRDSWSLAMTLNDILPLHHDTITTRFSMSSLDSHCLVFIFRTIMSESNQLLINIVASSFSYSGSSSCDGSVVVWSVIAWSLVAWSVVAWSVVAWSVAAVAVIVKSNRLEVVAGAAEVVVAVAAVMIAE